MSRENKFKIIQLSKNYVACSKNHVVWTHRQIFLKSIFQRTLDLLKLDIEGSEWSALDQMMTSGSLRNVRQLLVEYHFEDLTTYEKKRNLGVFRRLYDYGFRVFSREMNIGRAKFIKEFGYSVASFVEISYVNIRFI